MPSRKGVGRVFLRMVDVCFWGAVILYCASYSADSEVVVFVALTVLGFRWALYTILGFLGSFSIPKKKEPSKEEVEEIAEEPSVSNGS